MPTLPEFGTNEMSGDVLPTPIRVVVTGSGGFVGRWFLKRLQEEDIRDLIRVFPLFEQSPESHQGDITNGTVVADAIGRLKPDCVLHLAAIANPSEGGKDPRRLWDVNVFGTFNLAYAMLDQVPGARLIFVSSSDVYGSSFNLGEKPIAEDTLARPVRPYGASKLAAEVLVGQLSYEGLQNLIFRPFNHTGPGQTSAYVVSSFARQIAAIEAGLNEPVLRVGNLDAKRDFLDVRDVVDAYIRAIVQPRVMSDGPINLATGSPVSVGLILETLLGMSRCKEKIQVRTDPNLMRPSEIPVMSGDRTKAKALLGWEPQIPLQNTISDMLSYWRSEIRASL
jgi:GDP-4-dehydro-6-deoxy-D-mannose reductase